MNSRRRIFLSMLGVTAANVFGERMTQAAPLEDAGKPRKNIVIMVADDFGANLHSSRLVPTPNLDAIAGISAQFVNAYAASASCTPSRASLFSGVFPHKHGAIGLSSEPNWFALSQSYRGRDIFSRLAANGYYTGRIGKLHINPADSFVFHFKMNPDMRSPEEIRRALGEFLLRAKQPFVLLVGLFDPHAIKNRYVDQYQGYPERPISPEQVAPMPFQQIDEPEQRARIAGYFNSIQRLDKQVGVVMSVLREASQLDKTAVLFTSDQGPAFVRSKTSLYEASLRVPLFLHEPGCKAGIHTGFVSHVDVFPTLMRIAGVQSYPAVDGVDLSHWTSGGSSREYLFAESNYHFPCSYFPRRSVRDSRYKLIENLAVGIVKYRSHAPIRVVDGDNSFKMSLLPKYDNSVARKAYSLLATPTRYELYDLHNDPYEMENLAGRSDYGLIEQHLVDVLHRWQRETNDPYLDHEYVKNDWKKYCDKGIAYD